MVLRAHDVALQAEACFAHAARLDPEDPRWPYLHGRSLWHRDGERAVNLLEQAVELSGNQPVEPRFKLAEALLELGRLDAAESHFAGALNAAPQLPRGLLGMGRLALRREQFETATKYLERCTESPYSRHKALTLLAGAYQRLGRADDAARASARAAAAPPDLDFDLDDPFMEEAYQAGVSKSHRKAFASQLQAQERYADAAEVLREIVRDDPDAWTHVMLAECLLRDGSYTGAAEAAHKALLIDPNLAQAAFLYGAALYHAADQRDLAGSATLLRQARGAMIRTTALKPDHGFAFNYLGRIEKRLGQWPQAVAAWTAALRCLPGFADPQLALAEGWLDQGQPLVALIHLEQAVRLGADSPQVSKLRARIIVRLLER
jgi:tetratricopeptide (TPR) repeat protein